ncbi:MAG: MolR family transcriptional regulator, partial [Rhodococcus sp.]|nr:MolR family transcriptional regulator [Rhodococcus sp. (in: high G+C Gram-positive bacteria)]
MKPPLYIDDPVRGLSPKTSHPRFAALAPSRFYDEGDEFGPFGSDVGNDALRELEEWHE